VTVNNRSSQTKHDAYRSTIRYLCPSVLNQDLKMSHASRPRAWMNYLPTPTDFPPASIRNPPQADRNRCKLKASAPNRTLQDLTATSGVRLGPLGRRKLHTQLMRAMERKHHRTSPRPQNGIIRPGSTKPDSMSSEPNPQIPNLRGYALRQNRHALQIRSQQHDHPALVGRETERHGQCRGGQ